LPQAVVRKNLSATHAGLDRLHSNNQELSTRWLINNEGKGVTTRNKKLIPRVLNNLLQLTLTILLTHSDASFIEAQSTSISLVQHIGKDAGSTTASSLSFPSNNTAGNLIVVAMRAGRSGEVFTVTDSNGNSYRQAAQMDVTVDVPAGDTLAIFYAENIKNGPNTVTVADSLSGATLRFAILEYSGIVPANSLDGMMTAQGTSNSPSSGSITTTANGDLLVGIIMSAEGMTFSAGTGYTLRDQVPGSPDTKLITEDRIQALAGSASATAALSSSNAWGAAIAAFRASAGSSPPVSDLILAKTHTGPFTQGQTGATYSLTVSNIGSAPSSGSVSVTDTVPSGLTATALSGSGWACDLPSHTCTRSDSLGAGANYSPITLTVNVAANAPSSVTNTATVSGGGESNTSNDGASDPTPISSMADTAPPSAPQNLTATPVGTQMNLNWNAATDNVAVTQYRVEQCQGSNCANFSEIATVDTGPGTGPLSASANPNYFKDSSGKPLILVGSHTWNNLQDWGTNGSLQTMNFNAFVDDLSAHGHNFTLLWTTELPRFCGLPTTSSNPPNFIVDPHPWQRTGPGTATDGGPKFDLTKLSQPYFDRLRSRVQTLNNAGIYAGVYLFTGEWLNVYRCAIDGYPFTGGNNINGIDDGGGTNSVTMTAPNAITAIQDTYVRKVVDTLNDLPNVLWIVSEEAPASSTWWNGHLISLTRSYEAAKPFQHPIGYGVLSNNLDATIINSDADWIAPASRTSPTTSCGSGTPRCKVNINDSDHSYFGMWNDSAQTNRNYAWENFTNGNQVAFMDPYDVYYPRESRNLCASPTNGICSGPDSRWNNFRDNLGYILRYSRKLNLANVTPRSSLCSTSNCLAQTPSAGAEYLVYAPNGGTFTVNLSAMSSSRTLNVEWFNPATGETTTSTPIPAGSSSRSFTPPFSGDAVLYLVDSVGHASSNSAPTSYQVRNLAPGTYSFRVRAGDAAGNLGAYSNIASGTISSTGTPDLMVTKSHSGNFAQGQVGATYTLSVTNSGTASTVGTVTVSDSLPSSLSATAMSGTGWNCVLSSLTCTRNDALAGGANYPDITLTVTVASNAPASVTNTATVGGGGETNTANDTSSDVTSIQSASSGPISLVQHVGKDAGTTASSSLAFPAANTAGNWIGVLIRASGIGQVFSVSDTRGNTYRQAVQFTETVDGNTIGIFYAENVAAGTNTVTVSDTTSGTLRFAILEYAGVSRTGSIDGAKAAQGTSAAPNSGAITTTANGDLVLGLISTANSATFTAGSGFTIQERVPTSGTKLIAEDQRQAAAGAVAATATLSGSDVWSSAVSAFRAGSTGGPTPDMTLTKSHAGSFMQGQTGATYTLTVTNSGTGSTSGAVTVTDSLPTGLSATAMSGSGWSCMLSSLTCTQSSTLAGGTSYPAITLTVNVSNSAPASVTNMASVSGGGEINTANNSASDATSISSTSLSVAPRVAVLTFNQTQQFSGGSGNVTWLVDSIEGGSTTSGTITTSGLYTPPNNIGTHTVTALTSSQSANATVYVTNYPGTFTRDVDNLRTGLNSRETVLTPANVNASQFGKLFSYSIDGVSDASPLYVPNVNIPGKGLRNVVYVATEHDSVYAFDADGSQSSPLWHVSFINPANGITTVPPNDTGECCDISPEIGITGSPVIDGSTNTLFVVAKTKEVSGGNATYVHRLHALDITTGSEKLGGPVVISGSVVGNGDGSSGGRVPFLSLRENQRAALLLSNGVVYVAFAGHGDQPPYHGWLFGYSASTLQQVMVHNTTPNGAGGGVWQSGDGLATDTTGNIFFVSGNGDFNANRFGGRNYGDSFVKLDPNGNVLDYFTPHDQATMQAGDLDLGSGGTILLPDQSGPHPHLAISAGKNGSIYVVDRDNMGHYRSSDDSQIVQVLVNTFPGGTFTTGNFKAPVYWNGYLYFSADADYLKSFQVVNGLLSTTPTSQSTFVVNYPGATLSTSSNGNTNAILWAVQRVDYDPLGGGVRDIGSLHAFDATNLANELYNSNQSAGGRDSLDYTAKWAAPLVANGKVFVASNSRLTVFGLLP